MGVWDFIQDQVLGMQLLNALIGMGLSSLGLDVAGRIGGSIQFFSTCRNKICHSGTPLALSPATYPFASSSSTTTLTCRIYQELKDNARTSTGII